VLTIEVQVYLVLTDDAQQLQVNKSQESTGFDALYKHAIIQCTLAQIVAVLGPFMHCLHFLQVPLAAHLTSFPSTMLPNACTPLRIPQAPHLDANL
jgi:hypothetical protein